MEVEFLACPTCTEVTVVEIPPCLDSHGFDCPDRACTMCGTALTIAGVAMVGDIAANSARRHERPVRQERAVRQERPVRHERPVRQKRPAA